MTWITGQSTFSRSLQMVVKWEGQLIHLKWLQWAEKLEREEPHEVKKGEIQVLHLGSSNSRYRYTLLESSFAKKDLDVLVYNKLIMSQQCAFTKKECQCLRCYSRQSTAKQVELGDFSLLFSTGQATPGVLCPGLGSSVQERYGTTGESPVKNHQDDEGTVASFIQEKAARVDTVQPMEEKAWGESYQHVQISDGWEWRKLKYSSQWHSVTEEEALFTNWNTQNSIWTWKKPVILWGWANTGKGWPERIHPWRYSKSDRTQF